MIASLMTRAHSRACLLAIALLCFGVLSGDRVNAQVPTWDWVADGRLTGTPIFGGITTYGIGVDKTGNVFFGGAIADPSVVGSANLSSLGGSDIFLAKTNSTGAIQWAKTYGTANADQIIDMVTDSAGNLYAQIYFGSPNFSLDGQNVTSLIFGCCVAKFDANGTCTIAKTVQRIAIYVGGLDYSPLGFMAMVNATMIAKLNMNCDTIWTRTIPTGLGAQQLFYDVAIDKDGNILACGTFGGTVNFGGITLTTPSTSDLDCFVVKYNTSGTVLWARQFGSRAAGSDLANSLTTDQAGNVYVFGDYYSKIGIQNDTLTNSNALSAVYLARYSPTGTYEWALNGTSTNQNFSRQVVCDPDNNIWVAMAPGGTVNFAGSDHVPSTQMGTMLVCINTSGQYQSRLKPTGLGLSDPKRLIFNTAGDALYVGGYHLASNPTTVTFGSTTLNTSGCYIAKGSPGVPTDVADDLIRPSDFTLAQNYPNPFNPSTTIAFSLARRAEVDIEIFNIRGQKVRSLLHENRAAGSHSVVWDGSDETGNLVATGVYLYRLSADGVVQTKKMVMLK